MTVYVDDMEAPYGHMIMCHMVADSHDELNAMADKIGVSRRWIQHPGSAKEHYGISKSRRLRAIAAGAVEVTQSELGERMYALRKAERAERTAYQA